MHVSDTGQGNNSRAILHQNQDRKSTTCTTHTGTIVIWNWCCTERRNF